MLYSKVISKSTVGPDDNGEWELQACFNPSNAEATFVQSTKTQIFLKTI